MSGAGSDFLASLSALSGAGIEFVLVEFLRAYSARIATEDDDR